MGIDLIKESELDKINTYVGMYNNSGISAALTAIGQMNVEQIKKYGQSLAKAVDILKCNKNWRKHLIVARTVDSKQCSVLSTDVFVPMCKLGMGKASFDVNIGPTKHNKNVYTVYELQEARIWKQEMRKKKVALRLSRQADVALYSYIVSIIEKIMPDATGKDLEVGFNYIHALVELHTMSEIARAKAAKAYKDENRKFTEVKVEERDATVNGNKTPDDGRATPNPRFLGDADATAGQSMPSKRVAPPMPPAPSPSKPKKPAANTISVDEKSTKWETYDENFKSTYLVKTDMYRKFTDKKKAKQKDYVYNESKFNRAVEDAQVTILLEAKDNVWLNPTENTIDIEQLVSHEINYGGKNQKLTCWRMLVQSGQENSNEMKELRKALDRAGVKLATAH